MKSREAAWRALRRPVTFRQAAKLLGVTTEVIEELVSTLELMTISAKGRELIPISELKRFHPAR